MQVVTDGRVVILKINCVPIENATVGINLVHDFSRYHAPCSNTLDELIVCIYVVIGNTVTHNEALEVVGVVKLFIHLLS